MSLTPLFEVNEDVQGFCEARDWDQFHDALRPAAFLRTESNELLDLFRHVQEDEMDEAVVEKHEDVKGVLGDIFFILVRFAQFHDIDSARTFRDHLGFPVMV